MAESLHPNCVYPLINPTSDAFVKFHGVLCMNGASDCVGVQRCSHAQTLYANNVWKPSLHNVFSHLLTQHRMMQRYGWTEPNSNGRFFRRQTVIRPRFGHWSLRGLTRRLTRIDGNPLWCEIGDCEFSRPTLPGRHPMFHPSDSVAGGLIKPNRFHALMSRNSAERLTVDKSQWMIHLVSRPLRPLVEPVGGPNRGQ